MTIGLDIGSCWIRSIRRHGSNLVGRSTRNVYAVLPSSDSQRRLLQQACIAYAESEQNLVLLGDAAVELSELFQSPAVAPLRAGKLSDDDPVGRQVLACMVESLLPEPLRAGELCCFSLPGDTLRRDAQSHEERDFITRVVRLRGYTPTMISAGLALVFSTLVETGFTGIGFVLGASASECVVAHQGRELVQCSIPRGGDWLDEQLARCFRDVRWAPDGDDFLDLETSRKRRQEFRGSLAMPRGSEEQAVAELFRGLLAELLKKAGIEMARHPQVARLPRPLAVVCCGGLTDILGFGDVLDRAIAEADLPIETERARIAADSRYAIARGCLIQAELEADSQRNSRVA